MVDFITRHTDLIKEFLTGMVVPIKRVNYFTRYHKNEKARELTVLYAQVEEAICQKLNKLTDKLMRELLKEEIITPNQLKDMNVVYDHNQNLYRPQTFHISLFRARGLFEDEIFKEKWSQIQEKVKGFQAEIRYFDISTMGKEYDQTQFYLPLHRIYLKDNQKPLYEKPQIKPQTVGKEEV